MRVFTHTHLLGEIQDRCGRLGRLVVGGHLAAARCRC